MNKKIEVRDFEDIVNKLNKLITHTKIDDSLSDTITNYIENITFKVLKFIKTNKNKLDENSKIKAITSVKTSPLLVDMYQSVLDKAKEEFNIDYELIKTGILDDGNTLYLMIDEPITYHMNDNSEIIEDKNLNIGTKPSISVMDELSININPTTVYLGDIETYREQSKFKGAMVGDPTKIKL